MSTSFQNMHRAIPEIILLLTACAALKSELFLRARYRAVAYVMALVGLMFAGAWCTLYLGQYSVLSFHDLFITDDMGQLMKVFILLCVGLSFFYGRRYIDERQMPAAEYYVLGLFSTLGMMVLVSAHSLLTVYLGLELFSLPLYAMTAIRRTNSDASEAAMKYFVMGAIASAMLLYGISLMYGATGKLDLTELANTIAANWQHESGMLAFALVFIFAGVGFKMAAVPFHVWAPDVYEGAPASVTLLLSAAPKIAAVGMALRLVTIGFVDLAVQWQQLVLVMAVLSVGIGNLLAVVQTNIKRLLAYSAISHLGFALFGVLAANPSGYAASLYYIVVYAIMSTAAFGLVVIMSSDGHELEQLEDLKGLNKRHPWLAFMMLVVMFSMAGVPPTVGFFTKLLVLKAVVDAQMLWVAVVGLLFAVVGAYYYIRIVKLMYFDEAEVTTPISLSRTTTLVFSLNCLSLLYFGIFPSGLITMCLNAFAN